MTAAVSAVVMLGQQACYTASREEIHRTAYPCLQSACNKVSHLFSDYLCIYVPVCETVLVNADG